MRSPLRLASGNVVVFFGFRRQTYYRRKGGHRPEEVDAHIGDLLHQTFCELGILDGVSLSARTRISWNHKRVYRIWKAEGLHLRRLPKRPKVKRVYQDSLGSERNQSGLGHGLSQRLGGRSWRRESAHYKYHG